MVGKAGGKHGESQGHADRRTGDEHQAEYQ